MLFHHNLSISSSSRQGISSDHLVNTCPHWIRLCLQQRPRFAEFLATARLSSLSFPEFSSCSTGLGGRHRGGKDLSESPTIHTVSQEQQKEAGRQPVQQALSSQAKDRYLPGRRVNSCGGCVCHVYHASLLAMYEVRWLSEESSCKDLRNLFDVGQHSIKPWFCSGMTSWDLLTASPLAIYLPGKVEAEIRLLPPGEKANLQELQSSVA